MHVAAYPNSVQERHGEVRPAATAGEKKQQQRQVFASDAAALTLVTLCYVVMVSAADSQFGGRHQRGHPERHWHRTGGGPVHSPWAAVQNYGKISPLEAPFAIFLRLKNISFCNKSNNLFLNNDQICETMSHVKSKKWHQVISAIILCQSIHF